MESMVNEGSRLASACPVFVCDDVGRTVDFYVGCLGFKSAKHYDKAEKFATIYRDGVEFVVIQAKPGECAVPVRDRSRGPDDAYIVTATPQDVDPLHAEFSARGVKILETPHRTDYGSYEFAIEDIDGRRIGIGRIVDSSTYFRDSDFIVA